MKFFLLLDAAFASNRTFAAVLLGLVLCLIVLILLALSRKGGKTDDASNKRDERIINKHFFEEIQYLTEPSFVFFFHRFLRAVEIT